MDKFGYSKKYQLLKLRDFKVEEKSIQRDNLQIQSVYYCIEPIEMNLYIIVKYSEYNLKIIDFNHNLKFWNWFGDESRTIRGFFKELFDFSKKTECQPYGRILTKSELDILESDNISFISIKLIMNKPNSHWLEDLFFTEFDLNHNIDRIVPQPIQYWYNKLKDYYIKYYLN